MLLLLFTTASAAEFDTTARAAMAGAGTAVPGDLSAARHAPAAMVLGAGKSTQIDAAYGAGIRLGTGMMDTETNAFGAALVYSREWDNRLPPLEQRPGWMLPGEQDNEIRDNATRLSLGYGFLPESARQPGGVQQIRRLGIGASLVYEHNVSALRGVQDGVELDLSLAGRPGPYGNWGQDLIIAATVHDLLPDQTRSASGEAGFWWRPLPILELAGDGVWDPSMGASPWGGRGGIRVVMAQSFSVSAGYAYLDTTTVAGGLGVQAEGIKLHYAAQYTPESGEMVHTVGLVGPL